jgi:hypothetical protein
VGIEVVANGGVATVEIDEKPMLQINTIGAIMSTSEALPTLESNAKTRHQFRATFPTHALQTQFVIQ